MKSHWLYSSPNAKYPSIYFIYTPFIYTATCTIFILMKVIIHLYFSKVRFWKQTCIWSCRIWSYLQRRQQFMLHTDQPSAILSGSTGIDTHACAWTNDILVSPRYISRALFRWLCGETDTANRENKNVVEAVGCCVDGDDNRCLVKLSNETRQGR